MCSDIGHPAHDQTVHFGFASELTPDVLSALMRSTWTWDDRALRRDLACVLVGDHAARAVEKSAASPASGVAATLRARNVAATARFVGTVLGPQLLADAANNPLRDYFLPAASNPAQFDRMAADSFEQVQIDAADYLRSVAAQTDYPPESSWLGLVAERGTDGLGEAMRSYGNTLSASSFFGSLALAWQALQTLGDDGKPLADKLEQGDMSATLAAAEQSGSWDPALVRTRAVHGPRGWALSGTKHFVPAAAGADVIFTIARSVAGPSLFAVDASAPGLEVAALPTMEPSRPLYQVRLSDTPAELVGTEGGGGRLMMAVVDRATTAVAAEQIGLIEKAITVLLAHTSIGTPTDRASATLAEIALDHIAATALWRQALTPGAPSPAAAAVAHIACSAAAIRVADVVTQITGASDAATAIQQRAIAAALIFGGPAVSHERLLERLGI